MHPVFNLSLRMIYHSSPETSYCSCPASSPPSIAWPVGPAAIDPSSSSCPIICSYWAAIAALYGYSSTSGAFSGGTACCSVLSGLSFSLISCSWSSCYCWISGWLLSYSSDTVFYASITVSGGGTSPSPSAFSTAIAEESWAASSASNISSP